jgi:hypothetical protein
MTAAMSTLRIRFSFNQQTGQYGRGAGGTKGADNFARVIINEVAIRASEGLWKKLQGDIRRRLHDDVTREVNHLARLLMVNVIGIPGRNLGPRGNIDAAAPASSGFSARDLSVPTRNLVGDWARRSPGYLKSRGGSSNAPWFQNGERGPSPLGTLGRGSTWTAAFGPISVSVKKLSTYAPNDAALKSIPVRLGGTKGGSTRVVVATVRVAAMNRITTDQLASTGAGGALKAIGASPQSSGLLSKLGPSIAWRLGGNPARVPFRPTIHPFLSFFITRSLPNAVFKRMEQGLLGKGLSDGTGSGGRAVGAAKTQQLRASGVLPKF